MSNYIESIKVGSGEAWPIRDKEAHNRLDDIVNLVYPVGSIYMSTNLVSPETLFGGTWERIQDRFLLAAGDTYDAGTTGGEATHILTIGEMPGHRHSAIFIEDNGQFLFGTSYDAEIGFMANRATLRYNTGPTNLDDNQEIAFKQFTTNDAGEGKAHNNMPPYLTVYMWRRTN